MNRHCLAPSVVLRSFDMQATYLNGDLANANMCGNFHAPSRLPVSYIKACVMNILFGT